MEDILQIQENYTIDDSVKSYEDFAYQPISGTQLNSAGEITIRIENQDAYFHPHRSWLQIEGQLTTSAAAAYAGTDLVTLTNNGLMFLFENARYELSGKEIESVYHPGHATTILGLTKYPQDRLNQCWTLDTGDGTAAAATNEGFKKRQEHIVKDSLPIGSFRFAVNLSHIFGFCEDYDKIMYGFVHSLTLVRAGNDNAIFRAAAVAAGKVSISSIKWMMPRLVVNDRENVRLYKTIESKETIDVGFRMRQLASIQLTVTKTFTWRLGIRSAPEKPRYIMIAFQTNRENNQEKNVSTYDHCGLTNIYVLLNNSRYPAIDFNASFAKNHYAGMYKNLADFTEKFYGLDPLAVQCLGVDPLNFKNLFPIFIVDVSKQSERLKQGVVDITVEMFFEDNVAAATTAHALLISDRLLKFQSDGRKMNVIH